MKGGEKMQEEVTQQVIGLVVKTGKMTGSLFLRVCKHYLNKALGNKSVKNPSKIVEKAARVTLKSLVQEGEAVSNIEIQDKKIWQFERLAKKNGIKYAMKKDKSTDPPTYYIFFKGKNTEVIEHTLKEYTKKNIKRSKQPPIKEKIQKCKQIINEKERISPKIKNKEIVR